MHRGGLMGLLCSSGNDCHVHMKGHYAEVAAAPASRLEPSWQIGVLVHPSSMPAPTCSSQGYLHFMGLPGSCGPHQTIVLEP